MADPTLMDRPASTIWSVQATSSFFIAADFALRDASQRASASL
jgi:hypothetical protein